MEKFNVFKIIIGYVRIDTAAHSEKIMNYCDFGTRRDFGKNERILKE
ncbi:hypothetical protein ACFL4A_04005 [bacterium]